MIVKCNLIKQTQTCSYPQINEHKRNDMQCLQCEGISATDKISLSFTGVHMKQVCATLRCGNKKYVSATHHSKILYVNK